MAHEILSVKLCELEDQLARLNSRIHMSETADRGRLQGEILALRRECAENELTLRTKLRCSRSGMVGALADSYGEIEQHVQKAKAAMREQAARRGKDQADAEEKLLLVEYALDFALQASNRALLLAMEAIAAQLAGQEGEKTSP